MTQISGLGSCSHDVKVFHLARKGRRCQQTKNKNCCRTHFHQSVKWVRHTLFSFCSYSLQMCCTCFNFKRKIEKIFAPRRQRHVLLKGRGGYSNQFSSALESLLWAGGLTSICKVAPHNLTPPPADANPSAHTHVRTAQKVPAGVITLLRQL